MISILADVTTGICGQCRQVQYDKQLLMLDGNSLYSVQLLLCGYMGVNGLFMTTSSYRLSGVQRVSKKGKS